MLRLLAVFTLALGVASGAALAEDATVRIGHNRITPATITVKVGTKVTFLNEEEMPGGHSLVADDGSFASPALGKGESWSHTFDKPGTHAYKLKEHPSAKGSVIVE